MSISKNYTNTRGIATAYHRVVQVMVNPSQVLATVHSWPTKGMYEAAGPMALASVVETLEVPSSVLAPDAITAIEQWLINDQTSPLFGGTMLTSSLVPKPRNSVCYVNVEMHLKPVELRWKVWVYWLPMCPANVC
jgi:hypothetical protein